MDLSSFTREQLLVRVADLESQLAGRSLPITEDRYDFVPGTAELQAADVGTLFRDLSTGSFVFSAEGKRLFGYNPADTLTYQMLRDAIHPSSLADVDQAITRSHRECTTYDIEYQVHWPDGNWHWIRGKGRTSRNPDGHLEQRGIVIGIDHRKQVEQNLNRLRMERQAMLESAGEGIYGIDGQGRCTFINRAALEMFGYAREECLGRNMHQLIHHSYADGVSYPEQECPIYRTAQTGAGVRIDDEVIWRADGTALPVEYSAQAVMAEGRNEGTIVVINDILQRKTTELLLRRRGQQLRQSQEQLRAALEASKTSTFRFDLADSTFYWDENRAYLLGTELHRERQPLEDFLNGIHPDDRMRFRSALMQCGDRGLEFSHEFRILWPDGSIHHLYARGRKAGPEPSSSDDERQSYIDGAFVDITERKEADQAIRENEARFRSLLDATASTDWYVSGEGFMEQRQPEWSAFTGQTWDEYKGVGWIEMIHPEDRSDTWEAWLKASAAHDVYTTTHRVRRHDGVYRYMQARAVPIFDENGYLREWFGIHVDLTAEHETQLQLEQAKATAEEANRAKSQFLANMSHELRTPLNAIIGYSEMLQEEASDLALVSLQPDLARIHGAGKHLLSLINDVLDLSKIEAGKMEVYVESFDVAAIVEEVSGTIQPLMLQNGNRLMVDCAAGAGHIRSDATKLRQSLFNLLSNAAKFTNEGTVSVRVWRVPDDGAGEKVYFEVKDTGIGIGASQLANLFEPFAQGDRTTSRRYGGTGLGLAITQRFAEMLGGSIAVESTLGAGSTFTLCLPDGAGSPPVVQAAPSRDITPEQVTAMKPVVLVIDDDPAARELMGRYLNREGYHPLLANNGEEGLRLAREVRPQIVTLDVMMPGADGWSVLQMLKSDPVLADIPVIMITMLEDKNLGYFLGAADYLTKPINRQQLAHTLKRFECDNQPCNVLVVEDDADTRALLKSAVEREGWTAIEAEDGAAALHHLSRMRPHVILLDLLMPRMDGFDFVQALRRRVAWGTIPIVVITAKDVTHEDRARLSGAVAQIISKSDYSWEGLLLNIRQLLRMPQASIE